MSTTESLVRIRWRGKESVAEAVEYIEEQHNVEIDLPANYHHACFCRLYPEADQGAPDFIDIANGPEIISKISQIGGLESLMALVKPIKETGARVMMKSPTPRLYIGFELTKKRFDYL